MKFRAPIRSKLFHRAHLVDPDGNVSPLCAKSPRPLDLRKAAWTLRDADVTCPRCRRAMALRDASGPHLADLSSARC